MPQSLSRLVIHVVFSTKGREPFIDRSIRTGLHAYMAVVTRELNGCECYRVGGVEDHVHLAVRLSRTTTVAELVEHVKTTSSRWMKDQGQGLASFTWQRGYGAHSVYYPHLERLLAYIDGQEEHHRTRSFQEEYRALLDENGIEYDERFVWD